MMQKRKWLPLAIVPAAFALLNATSAIPAEVNDWSTSAASNNSAAPDGWPEDMNPSDVNNTAREDAARIKRWYADTNGSLVATGSSNAYVVAANRTLSAYYDGLNVCWQSNHDNDDASTLNVDAVGAKAVVLGDGTALRGGELPSGYVICTVYNSGNDQWEITNHPDPQAILRNAVRGTYATGDTFQGGIVADTEDASQVGKITIASAVATEAEAAMLDFGGHDSGGNDTIYARIEASAYDNADTEEDGSINFMVAEAGTLGDIFQMFRGLTSPQYPVLRSLSGSTGNGDITAALIFRNDAGDADGAKNGADILVKMDDNTVGAKDFSFTFRGLVAGSLTTLATLDGDALMPGTNGTVDLGGASNKFGGIYANSVEANLNFQNNQITQFELDVETEGLTSTTYTTNDTDCGAVLFSNSGSAQTITVHTSAGVGCWMKIVQAGAGQVTIAAAGGVNNVDSHTKISGQAGMIDLVVTSNAGSSPVVYISGDTGT